MLAHASGPLRRLVASPKGALCASHGEFSVRAPGMASNPAVEVAPSMTTKPPVLCPSSTRQASALHPSRQSQRRSSIRCFTTSASLLARPKKAIAEPIEEAAEEKHEDAAVHETSTLPLHCVFKVLAVETPPNYFVPWQKKSSKDCIGSGFVVKTPFGVKLLTNAHVVENATTVRIRRAGSPFMYSARVNAIANECDLAELVVSDPNFWKETHELEALNLADVPEELPPPPPPAVAHHPPTTSAAKKTKTALKKEAIAEVQEATKKASKSKSGSSRGKASAQAIEKLSDSAKDAALELGGLPELHARVTVIGYPTGGDNVSVTRGVVSRIEPQSYTDSPGHELLAIQIDAAINPGNSGGPALDDKHRVVGVAFCSLQGAENIGYIIPTPIIMHFLEDLQKHKGSYTGFVRLGLSTQSLDQNHAACEYFKLKPGMSGLLVADVDVVGDAHNKVKKDDVLLAVEGVPLANDGTVPFRRRERIHFDYLLMNKYKGDPCKLTVWRDGKEVELQIKLKPKLQELVPSHASNPVPNPPYLVYGGLVFTRLSFAYIAEYGDDWYNTAPRDLLHQAFHPKHLREDQEIVILSHVLVDDCNFGYNRFSNLALKKVNGVEVQNLQHLHTLINSNTDTFIRFDLDESATIVIKHEQALQAAERIKSNHGVPKLSSFEDIAAAVKSKKKEQNPL